MIALKIDIIQNGAVNSHIPTKSLPNGSRFNAKALRMTSWFAALLPCKSFIVVGQKFPRPLLNRNPSTRKGVPEFGTLLGSKDSPSCTI